VVGDRRTSLGREREDLVDAPLVSRVPVVLDGDDCAVRSDEEAGASFFIVDLLVHRTWVSLRTALTAGRVEP
jgi:hypothetical protein